MGLTTYTLRKFTLDQAIAMTKQVGRQIYLLERSASAIEEHAGTTKGSSEESRRCRAGADGRGRHLHQGQRRRNHNVFEYAKDAAWPPLFAAPTLKRFDKVEKAVKDYDLRIAIHNHGPGDKRYPSPLDVLRMVKDRDARMGLCMDVGHTVRIGEDPVMAIEKCAKRLYEFHMKDVTEAAAKGTSTTVGKVSSTSWEYESSYQNKVPLARRAGIRGLTVMPLCPACSNPCLYAWRVGAI